MEISVIIVSYNTCSVTKHCLDSVFKNTRDVSFEVIVVDNNSSDGSKEMLESYLGIIYVHSPLLCFMVILQKSSGSGLINIFETLYHTLRKKTLFFQCVERVG